VYAELDRQRETRPPRVGTEPSDVLAALRRGSAPALGKALGNDLQPAALALRPQLAELLETGLALGALGGVVSGSGPTVAFLARDEGHANALASGVSEGGSCRAVRVAHGPVPGARVVRSE
jgi:4-diphosphocytidyl-2-C-methyl-D-erythritol kinase